MANLSTILKRNTAGQVVTGGIADSSITTAKLAPTVISGATALSALDDADCVLISDISAADNKKVTLNDLGNYMKTKSTALLAVVTFNANVASGSNLPTGMAISHNPHGLSVSVNANRIQLGPGTWEIQAMFSGYYATWNGWGGANVSEQTGFFQVQIDGAASTSNVALSSARTQSMGGLNAAPASWMQMGNGGDALTQVKVVTSGLVTPVRQIDNVTGGVGVYSAGRSVAYVYKI